MKNILITGGCGFIGANFIHFLVQDSLFDGKVINVDALTYAGNLESLKDLGDQYPDQYTFVHGDICDIPHMAEVFKTYEIDTVCHFAAESHVDRSILTPSAFIKTNIEGTFNLLEQAKQKGNKFSLFHHISTDEVFGALGEKGYFREDTAYNPSSPYSASKAASDHLVRAYHKTYGLPVTITNCSNNYGPYQFPEKLIPLMINNALEDTSLPIYGDGRNVRDWLYVTDHCSAVWTVMREGVRGETYTIGGASEKNNLDVVSTICDILDEIQPSKKIKKRSELITFVEDRPGHDLRYAIDFSKIKRELGWEPKDSFESGIRKTIQWYLDHQNWVNRVKSGEYQQWIKRQYSDETT